MTLTVILLLTIAVFLIPAIVLPKNRLFTYGVPAFFAFALVFSMVLCEAFIPYVDFEGTIGKFFAPVISALMRADMTVAEINHISLWFFYLAFYLAVYLVVYGMMKLVFVGLNPSIKRPINVFIKFVESTSFFLFTFIPFAFFLIEIRAALPFADGFLESLMNLIYSLEA